MAERAGGDVGEGGVMGKYVCPKCGAHVRMVTYYTGWDEEILDPEDGEAMYLERSERSEVHGEEFDCSEDCGWKGGSLWKDELDEEQNEET